MLERAATFALCHDGLTVAVPSPTSPQSTTPHDSGVPSSAGQKRAVRSAVTALRGTVALSDLERRAPQIFRSGPMAADPTAPMRSTSVGRGGRLTAWCDSQPEDLLQRDEVAP